MASRNDVKPIKSTDRPSVILVVDDEVDILDSLQLLLERSLSNVRVLTAESGPAAIQVLKRDPVDLIITDYRMPGMDGLELLAKAAKIAPLTPTVLITAFPDMELAIRAINEARVRSFITKPMQPEKILEIIGGLLEEYRGRIQRDQAFARALDEMRRRLQSAR